VPTPAPSAPPIQDSTASEGPIYWSCELLATNFAGRTALHFALVHSTDAVPLYVLRSDRIKNEGKDDCDESLRVVACNHNNSSARIEKILLRWPMDVNERCIFSLELTRQTKVSGSGSSSTLDFLMICPTLFIYLCTKGYTNRQVVALLREFQPFMYKTKRTTTRICGHEVNVST
jgi:hypothetical protein